MNTKELRFSARELRAVASDKDKTLTGYACVWNTQTDIGPFFEVIAPKPFRSLDNDEVVMLMNHDDSLILGRSGVNLELSQDDIGLRFACTLNDSSIAQDVYQNTKSGILRECSFAFTVRDANGESWSTLPNSNGKMLRTLKDLRLWDTSVVTSPAYPGTSAKARNVVADDIQQRMTAANQAAETESRKQRLAGVLAEIQDENNKLSAREQLAIDSQLRIRNEVLKLL